MKKQKTLWIMAATLIMIIALAGTAFAASKGWVQRKEYGNTYWVYYDSNGSLHKGWLKSGGQWYFFKPYNGHMVPDTAYLHQEGVAMGINENGKVYRFNRNGVWANTPGWNQLESLYGGSLQWYYIQKDGTAAMGWKKIGGQWYYFRDSKINKWAGNGHVIVAASEGDPGGNMVTGDAYGTTPTDYGFGSTVNGVYSFYSNGVMKTNKWVQATVYDSSYSRTRQVWIYHGADGNAVKGWKKISGQWYYFNNDYCMQTGWQKIGGQWYYLGTDGAMVTGTKTIGGKTYTFSSDGVWVK